MKTISAFLFCLLFAASVHAGMRPSPALIGASVSASGGVQFSNANSTSPTGYNLFSFAHTIGAGEGRFLLVGLAYAIDDTPDIAVVNTNYNLILATAVAVTGSTRLRVYYASSAVTVEGVNTVRFHWNQTGTDRSIAVVSYVGVNQTTPFTSSGAASGSSTSGSNSVPSQSGDMVAALYGIEGAAGQSVTDGGGQTSRVIESVNGGLSSGSWIAASDKAGASGNVTASYTNGASQGWVLWLASLKGQ